MGIVVSTGKHEEMVAEKTTLLNEHKAKAERKRDELEAYKAKVAQEEAALQQELEELETRKAKLAEQQNTLQSSYSEMETLRQKREADVVGRCVLKISQRSLGMCFSEWKEFVTEAVREKDRQAYSGKVEELELKNRHLKSAVKEKQDHLGAVEEQNQKDKAMQLIMRLKSKEVAVCFNQWKGFVRANVEDRHRRSVEALQQKLEEMRADRDRLRLKLTDSEREGLKLAMTKFELEEKDLHKQSHISELAHALTQARDTIEQQVQQWPASSKSMRKELTALSSAYDDVVRVSTKTHDEVTKSATPSAVSEQPQPPVPVPDQPAEESTKEALETAPSPVTEPEEPSAESACKQEPRAETEPAAESVVGEAAPAELKAVGTEAPPTAPAPEAAVDTVTETELTTAETAAAVAPDETETTSAAEDAVRPAERAVVT